LDGPHIESAIVDGVKVIMRRDDVGKKKAA
jgi:hypothetical protein